ncbi:MAG: tryptophan synthase subunit alpha, partial [Muribaculaceae bacterium]|nr:tryptophan synthase subunit alpha [Muribaculaceae bacterium]
LGLRNPRLIGFGISNKATFEAACNHSSGAIIGSKFIKCLTEHPTDPKAAVASLISAINN